MGDGQSGREHLTAEMIIGVGRHLDAQVLAEDARRKAMTKWANEMARRNITWAHSTYTVANESSLWKEWDIRNADPVFRAFRQAAKFAKVDLTDRWVDLNRQERQAVMDHLIGIGKKHRGSKFFKMYEEFVRLQTVNKLTSAKK